LWEAFLLQMNDFDRFLESELRLMLDPVVETPAPPLKGRRKTRTPLLVVVTAPIELAAEAVTGEPAVVPVPVEPAAALLS
jgi:hypothetical protein